VASVGSFKETDEFGDDLFFGGLQRAVGAAFKAVADESPTSWAHWEVLVFHVPRMSDHLGRVKTNLAPRELRPRSLSIYPSLAARRSRSIALR
jgi:hypothetical protein